MNPLKLFLRAIALKEDALTNAAAWICVALAAMVGACIYIAVTFLS